ncbi:MAG: hypothetical protein L6W00_04330 [Lentisphaeria bacterium]|nr:MAG: hypothetical protein L6W00_04330 [Lentisphaeria bacterium]
MNTMFGFRNGTSGGNCISGYAKVRATAILNPSKAVMLSDTIQQRTSGEEVFQVYPYYLQPRNGSEVPGVGGLSSNAATQHFRHNGTANVTWADGHVSPERIGEFDDIGFARSNVVGWLGTTDAWYCLTRSDFEALDLTPGNMNRSLHHGKVQSPLFVLRNKLSGAFHTGVMGVLQAILS